MTIPEQGAVGAEDLFGEEMSRGVEALYLSEDAVRRRAMLLDLLALKPGEAVLDIGTGPGLLALDMADAVGPAGSVVAVDIAPPMLQIAGRRLGGRPWVTVRSADASDLDADDESFDVVVSVQVHEYVPDVATGLREIHRVLRPGGRALIFSTDWPSLVWQSDDENRMQRVLTAFAAHCPHQTYARTLPPALHAVGFEITERRGVLDFNSICDPSTFSYHLMGLVRGFVTGHGAISESDADAWVADLRRLAEEDRYFFAVNRYLYLVRKPA